MPASASPSDLALLLGLEKARESSVLGEKVLDLGHAGTRPVLEPGLGEVVLDAMKAAFAHGAHDRRHFWEWPWAVRLNLAVPRAYGGG